MRVDEHRPHTYKPSTSCCSLKSERGGDLVIDGLFMGPATVHAVM